MAHMVCALCRGAGHMFIAQLGRYEWWPCPACGGCGARVQYGPAVIYSGHAHLPRVVPPLRDE